jgi:hypothetical protein
MYLQIATALVALTLTLETPLWAFQGSVVSRPNVTVSSPDVTQAAAPLPSSGQVLVLGETHGSRDVPEYFLSLVRAAARKGRVIVGLELPATPVGPLCRGSRASWPAAWTPQKPDGRTSVAMRKLVCALSSAPLARRVQIVFLDDEKRGDHFDELAAARFDKAIGRRRAAGFILTGNYHARNVAGSLAQHLRATKRAVTTATVSSPAAETWICSGEPSTCGSKVSNINFCSQEPEDRRTLRWVHIGDPRFPWDYCLSVPSLSPSPPAESLVQ